MLSAENLGCAQIVSAGPRGCHHKDALTASSQQEGCCGQEARGPPGKWGLGAQYFQACRFLQCLNREGLCAGLPENSLFTFACGTEEN